MTHTYQITGMTCSSCEQKIKSVFLQLEEIIEVSVSKENGQAEIMMSKHIPLSILKSQLGLAGDKYQIGVIGHNETVEGAKSWFSTYKPVILIFAFIFLVTGLIEAVSGGVDITRWMRHYMAGFFLTFSFFKMLNLKGFKDNYQMYDVIARRFPSWGYIYAFMELLLGMAFLVNFNPLVTNTVMVIIMSLSIIGVLQTVLNKQAIQCACLGDVFKLPMSTVTIIEDGLMILMGLIMLIMAVF
ncbi:heavy-metal-associated domain-containing protein [Lewinella sp. LCG006]|uniref:heavy-metal-associated domain-containing protein n=1 Tax=Lewinella sp. LCG006 TaxID=3231911 RepID=UPI003460F688